MATAAYTNGYRQFTFKDFSGGLNLRDKTDAVDDGEAIDLLNVTFAERGAIRQRDGYPRPHRRRPRPTASTRWPRTTPPAASASSCSAPAPGWTSSTTPAPSSPPRPDSPRAVDVRAVRRPAARARLLRQRRRPARALGRHRVGARRPRPRPSTAPPAQAMPKAGAITVTAAASGSTTGTNASNRLVATGVRHPDRRPAPAAPKAPRPASTSPTPASPRYGRPTARSGPRTGAPGRGRNYIDLTPGDGEQIIAAVTWRELVFLFKQTKFFVLWGEGTGTDGNPTFHVRQVVNNVGLASPQAVAVGRDGVYFANRRGVYRTNGSDPVLLSDIIAPMWTQDPEVYFHVEPDQPRPARPRADAVAHGTALPRRPHRRSDRQRPRAGLRHPAPVVDAVRPARRRAGVVPVQPRPRSPLRLRAPLPQRVGHLVLGSTHGPRPADHVTLAIRLGGL